MLIATLSSQPQNFTSISDKFSLRKTAAAQVPEAKEAKDSFELTSSNIEDLTSKQTLLQKVGSKVTVFFEKVKTAIKPDEPEISTSVITYEPELYDDIDLKTDIIKALDEKGKLVHLVAKLGLDEVYDYVTGVDHDKLSRRYRSFLGKDQFDNLTHFYSLYTTAYNIIELTHGDTTDTALLIDKINHLKRYIDTSDLH